MDSDFLLQFATQFDLPKRIQVKISALPYSKGNWYVCCGDYFLCPEGWAFRLNVNDGRFLFKTADDAVQAALAHVDDAPASL